MSEVYDSTDGHCGFSEYTYTRVQLVHLQEMIWYTGRNWGLAQFAKKYGVTSIQEVLDLWLPFAEKVEKGIDIVKEFDERAEQYRLNPSLNCVRWVIEGEA